MMIAQARQAKALTAKKGDLAPAFAPLTYQ